MQSACYFTAKTATIPGAWEGLTSMTIPLPRRKEEGTSRGNPTNDTTIWSAQYKDGNNVVFVEVVAFSYLPYVHCVYDYSNIIPRRSLFANLTVMSPSRLNS